jgi:hypothetical protein
VPASGASESLCDSGRASEPRTALAIRTTANRRFMLVLSNGPAQSLRRIAHNDLRAGVQLWLVRAASH